MHLPKGMIISLTSCFPDKLTSIAATNHLLPLSPLALNTFFPLIMTFSFAMFAPYMWEQNFRHILPLKCSLGLFSFAMSPCFRGLDVSMYMQYPVEVGKRELSTITSTSTSTFIQLIKSRKTSHQLYQTYMHICISQTKRIIKK